MMSTKKTPGCGATAPEMTILLGHLENQTTLTTMKIVPTCHFGMERVGMMGGAQCFLLLFVKLVKTVNMVCECLFEP